MRLECGVYSPFLSLLLLCHDDDELKVQAQVRALLLWIECFPSSHEFFHDEQSRAPAAGSTKSSGRLLVDLLLGVQAGRVGMARVGNLGRREDGIQAKGVICLVKAV